MAPRMEVGYFFCYLTFLSIFLLMSFTNAAVIDDGTVTTYAVQASQCPIDSTTKLLQVSCRTQDLVSAVTCNADPNGGVNSGTPFILMADINLIQSGAMNANQRTLNDDRYARQSITYFTRGCWSDVQAAIWAQPEMLVRLPAGSVDGDALQSNVLPSNAAGPSFWTVYSDLNTAQIPVDPQARDTNNDWYQCNSLRRTTQPVNDVKNNKWYIYDIDFRACACKRPDCNGGEWPDAVEAYVLPLSCNQYCTETMTRYFVPVSSSTADASAAALPIRPIPPKFKTSCARLFNQPAAKEAYTTATVPQVCLRNVTACISAEARPSTKFSGSMQIYGNSLYFGGCYDEHFKAAAREAGFGQSAYRLNTANGSVDGINPAFACTTSYCNIIPPHESNTIFKVQLTNPQDNPFPVNSAKNAPAPTAARFFVVILGVGLILAY